MARIDLDTDAFFQQVMQDKSVQAKTRDRITKIANRTRRDLAKAGIDATVTIEENATPTGRASFNIRGQVNDKDKRRAGRIARRAARSVRR